MATDLQSAPFGHLGTCPKLLAHDTKTSINYGCLFSSDKKKSELVHTQLPLPYKLRMKVVICGHSLVYETLDSIDEVW